MNPIDWGKPVYGLFVDLFGTRGPAILLIVFLLVAGLIAYGIWSRVGEEYRKDHPVKVLAEVQTPVSSRQNVPLAAIPAGPLTEPAKPRLSMPAPKAANKEPAEVKADSNKDSQLPVHIEQHNEGSSGTNIAAQNVTINQDQPRSLSDKQRSDLTYAISKYPPQDFRITAFMSAPDGQGYGADVGTQILRGGWKVPGNAVDRAIATRVDGVRGLAVLVKDKSNPPVKALQLRDALNYAGLSVPILDGDGMGDDTVVLWVGSR